MGKCVTDKMQPGTGIKTMGLLAIGMAALLLACAELSSYPIHLRYAPAAEPPQVNTKLRGKVFTITTFADSRGLADPAIIGKRVDFDGKEIPFVSARGDPSANVTRAFKMHLFKKGYTVRGETPNWDLDPQTISTQWGDWVIGGSIEEMSVIVTSYVRTHYECKLKLKVAVADVRERHREYSDIIELSSSYKSVRFRLKNAERMINEVLTEAIERTLVSLDKE